MKPKIREILVNTSDTLYQKYTSDKYLQSERTELIKEIKWILDKSDFFDEDVAYNYIDLVNRLIEQINFVNKQKIRINQNDK